MLDWDRLLEQYGPMVWRLAYRLLGSRHEAEDCLQEAFLKALELSRKESVRSWPGLLRHLATTRSLDRLRQRSRERTQTSPTELGTVPDRGADPRQAAEAAELVSRLREALTHLPPRQAEVFALRFLEDMSYREIGAALGLKENAVGVLLHGARASLRALLNSRAPGGDKP
jgi:RNA polymerase sigma-70 factor (ECF subfamily)